jgi:formylglycine-generating enzyme required for sulfatase activity
MSDSVPDTAAPGAGPAPAAPPAARPDCVGRYRVERVLGEGSFGVVYLAHDDDLQRHVAIKVPTPRLLARPGASDAYLREARIVASLRHEHIVRVFDFGRTDGGACYIVSEYLEGGSLADLLRRRRPSAGEAAALVAAVAEALHHAHGHRLVHRDVKPGNILLDAAGHAHLADFGIALRDEDFGAGGGLAGTPWYMSPEQARGESHRVDGRADVYSLGAVLYELLTGQVPFRRERVADLLEDIASLTLEARPPRQLVTELPRELERICLKALAKRGADRYPTAHDFADDLRAFLAQHAELPALPAAVPAAPATPPPATPEGHSALESTGEATPEEHPLRVVPKGLRAFDAGDRDFFLQLLPGPRDRRGLPESVRFWKQRIEAADPEQAFPVGLLYGPSGCGKSSLVRAGLLPRLGRDVVAVYVEAAAGQTEARLCRGLARHWPELASHGGLVEALAALRRGEGAPAGGKVLLVLDQFEQFLHAHGKEGDTELVRALRQCDGARVQALLLVRDDFWLAVTRFLAALEVDLVQGHNTAVVDLFNPAHARKVLAAFGHAHGRLAGEAGQWTAEQQAFLDQVVAGLARDGQVVPVRLALFAEMVKGKPWEPATLKAVGGAQGVGVAFLEESFSAPSANPRHRLHQKAVRGVLRALLPEQGTDIKGSMRSAGQLEAAAGYAGRPRELADLMHVLDGELRLVTPTDPEGAGEPGDPGGVCPRGTDARWYQLTHDYLVPAVREWLTRKQKETRRGRAELRLAERAAAWNAKPESRHLPAWWEWLNVRLLTRRRDWTEPQRRMMRKACRYHAVRGLALVFFLLLLGWVGCEVYGRLLVESIITAETSDVPRLVEQLPPFRRWANARLLRHIDDTPPDSKEHLHASLALVAADEGQVEYLSHRLLDASPTQLSVIRDALRAHEEELTGQLWAVLGDEQQDIDRRFRAACALAGYDTVGDGRWRKASPLVVARLLAAVKENPSHYTPLLELLRPVRGALLRRLSEVYRDKKRAESERYWAASVLADYASNQPQALTELIVDADDRQFITLLPALARQCKAVLPLLRSAVSETERQRRASSETERQRHASRQAAAALALARLGVADPLWSLLKSSPYPEVRSRLIHRLCPASVRAHDLVERLLAEKAAASVRAALVLALGEYGRDQFPAGLREERLVPFLLEKYKDDPDPGVHGAIDWLLRHGKEGPIDRPLDWSPLAGNGLEKIDRELKRRDPDGKRGWYVNGQGQTFTVIESGEAFLMGSPRGEADRHPDEEQHGRVIGRRYAISTKPVTVAQFKRFRKAHHYTQRYSPEPNGPIISVPWYEAARYCNWLSEQEGIAKDQWCYPDKIAAGMKPLPDHLKRTGYRLPTEAEWEYACRAGALTSRHYGSSVDLLPRYAWYLHNSQDRTWPVGQKRPNDLGLFDTHGNVSTWCQESSWAYPAGTLEKPVRDKEDGRAVREEEVRVYRNGSCVDPAVNVRSAYRSSLQPAREFYSLGLRVARTVP